MAEQAYQIFIQEHLLHMLVAVVVLVELQLDLEDLVVVEQDQQVLLDQMEQLILVAAAVAVVMVLTILVPQAVMVVAAL
jgi:hypothetical protein